MSLRESFGREVYKKPASASPSTITKLKGVGEVDIEVRKQNGYEIGVKHSNSKIQCQIYYPVVPSKFVLDLAVCLDLGCRKMFTTGRTLGDFVLLNKTGSCAGPLREPESMAHTAVPLQYAVISRCHGHSGAVDLAWDLGICFSNKLLGDVKAADVWTYLSIKALVDNGVLIWVALITNKC